jgi:pyruvate dehydrogenase E2 component (dihydrolipoamide acetyltransferase)
VLLLVTLGLVLVAMVTLVIGVFSNHLQPIYISIVASIAAAVLLGLISWLNRREPSDVTTADAPAPLAAEDPESGPVARQSSGEGRPGPLPAAAAPLPAAAAPLPAAAAAPFGPAADSASGPDAAERHGPRDGDMTHPEPPPPGIEPPSGGESPFPIDNYDELRVAQILIVLAELDGGELERVAARERQGAGRNTILNRIDRLQRTGPAASPENAAPA